MATKYDGVQQRICPTGGVTRVILGTTTDDRGNGGTSLPCKGCWVQAVDANTDVVRMNIGAAADDDTGIDLGRPYIYADSNKASAATCQPMWVPISDVAQLYFFSSDSDAKIDILYLLG